MHVENVLLILVSVAITHFLCISCKKLYLLYCQDEQLCLPMHVS